MRCIYLKMEDPSLGDYSTEKFNRIAENSRQGEWHEMLVLHDTCNTLKKIVECIYQL